MDELAAILPQVDPVALAKRMAKMAPPAIEVLERAMAEGTRQGWRSNPLAMGVAFGELQAMAHTALLSAKFVEAVTGEDPFQIWNLPPQHGKSLIASRYGPAWALEHDPAMRIALTSYGDELADENAVAVRDILLRHDDMLTTQLRRDRRRADRFVTEQGGGVIAAGVGSALTGFGAHGAVVDDPFKNWQEAHSEARRVLVWNWLLSVVRTRLNRRGTKPGWLIIVMTRWHEDDLSGRALRAAYDGTGDPFTLVRLPALAEAPNPHAEEPWLRLPDPLGRAPGEALAPILHPKEEIERSLVASGSYLSAGLYQQRPAPEEGTDIMRGWWRWYDSLPARFDDALTSWDMKLKDKESGDFVVGQAWGRLANRQYFVEQFRGQFNEATTRAAIALMQVRFPYIKRHIIENTGNGPEVIAALSAPQPGYTLSEDVVRALGVVGITPEEVEAVQNLIRRGMTGLIPENPRGDKRVRARTYTPLIEAGNCYLPSGHRGADQFVNEAAAFPNGSHDDAVDSWSQAMKRLATSAGAVATKPERRVGKPAPGARAQVADPRGRRATLLRAPRIR